MANPNTHTCLLCASLLDNCGECEYCEDCNNQMKCLSCLDDAIYNE